jgi:adenylosuccinate synthase
LRAVLDEKNLVLERVYGVRPLAFNDVRDRLMQQGERLRPMICDTTQLLMEADDAGQRVLLEGAQGGLLDVDFGTYPYVTSSNSSALGITAGAGLPPRRIGRTLGVVKAYTSRVGEGPFPTEEKGETGERIRKQGREYGATTGRPRRCGWFDAVAVRYVIMLNGIDTLAVTNLDVLKGFPSIRVCVGYRLDGREVSAAAPDIATLQKVEPIYREFPGFEEDIGAVRRFADLPEAARRYVEFLESTLGVPFGIVSVGQERDRVIFRQDFKL